MAGTTATFSNPAQNQYGAGVSAGNLLFTYPFATTDFSTIYLDYKLTIRWSGGYSAIWANINSLGFGSYTKLWANPANNLIVLLMPARALSFSETMSITGLVNPSPYQKSLYSYINTLTLSFYRHFFL